MEHVIDVGNAKPVKTFPRWLLFTLRRKLEDELNKLLATGCIEQFISPYASGLVYTHPEERWLTDSFCGIATSQ